MEQASKRGRRPESTIRSNICELIYFFGEGYGYDLYKKYIKAFEKISMRSVYYHLQKGVELGEFKVKKIDQVEGNYSWGPHAQRIIFALGPMAKPRGVLAKKWWIKKKLVNIKKLAR